MLLKRDLRSHDHEVKVRRSGGDPDRAWSEALVNHPYQLGVEHEPLPVANERESQEPGLNVLYIDSAARSGSTILARAVGAQPQFMTVGEAVLVWRFGVLGN